MNKFENYENLIFLFQDIELKSIILLNFLSL